MTPRAFQIYLLVLATLFGVYILGRVAGVLFGADK